ncbi:hypothetical protein A1OE_1385 [Candidatus Endolissoclinum faulkneri L2]|uniref:Uncharacterized protein n=1 Tax=Candidatus Endolissoclinum faulkneri L2 TaxID=1193729 RepID=K7YSN5_9PROT|nr:hypothetical protein A1OE_1385 [Candidatus Endolissoclinum faulkneri L2]
MKYAVISSLSIFILNTLNTLFFCYFLYNKIIQHYNAYIVCMCSNPMGNNKN